MNTRKSQLSFVCPAILGCLLASTSLAWEVVPSAPSERGPQVVALLNGSVIQGTVQQSENENRLVVTNGPWYEVRVPIRDVDFVAKDFGHAYRLKRKRLHEHDRDGHLKLAQWCLRHNQESLAGRQLVHLVRIAPNDKGVETFEKRLRHRVDQATSAGTPARLVSRRRFVESGADARATNDGLTYALPVNPRATSADLPPLPGNATGQFTRFVQPLVLNRCGQATCHGSASSNTFQLRRSTGRTMRRELTWRNLRAALEQIDQAHPEASPLLVKAATIHGGSTTAPIQPRELEQLQRLAGWVANVTQHRSLGSGSATTTPLSPPSSFEEASPSAAPSNALKSLYKSPKANDAAGPGIKTSSDPFDPDGFND